MECILVRVRRKCVLTDMSKKINNKFVSLIKIRPFLVTDNFQRDHFDLLRSIYYRNPTNATDTLWSMEENLSLQRHSALENATINYLNHFGDTTKISSSVLRENDGNGLHFIIPRTTESEYVNIVAEIIFPLFDDIDWLWAEFISICIFAICCCI